MATLKVFYTNIFNLNQILLKKVTNQISTSRISKTKEKFQAKLLKTKRFLFLDLSQYVMEQPQRQWYL